MLTFLGVRAYLAWGFNRTAVVEKLEELGQTKLAENIRCYYMSGWGYFLSGFKDTSSARSVVQEGINVMTMGYLICNNVSLVPGESRPLLLR